jgi:hypothetical protein
MTDKPLQIRNSTAEFLIFTAQAGEQGIEVRCEGETVWLTQKMMAELFEISVPAISQHLKNIFASKELENSSVIKNFLTTAADGKRYNTQFYSLDAIISVGYRVQLGARHPVPAMGNGRPATVRPSRLCARPPAHGKRHLPRRGLFRAPARRDPRDPAIVSGVKP